MPKHMLRQPLERWSNGSKEEENPPVRRKNSSELPTGILKYYLRWRRNLIKHMR